MTAAITSRRLAPLVWSAGPHVYGWVERGIGFVLDDRVGQWTPLSDASLCAGRVLGVDERLALVLTHGRPTP